MSEARDKLIRLVGQLDDGDVNAVLAVVRDRAKPSTVRPWPPSWFGSIDLGPTDVSERVDEVLAQSFGRC